MLKISILCVGGLKEDYWKSACAEYAKRLGTHVRIRLVEIPEERLPDHPSQANVQAALAAEAARLQARLKPGAYIVALCVEGRQMDSTAFARLISDRMGLPGEITFLIGGSYGLSEAIKSRAALRLSFSEMTFPHMLARVLLYEQLYRAVNFLEGGRYHK